MEKSERAGATTITMKVSDGLEETNRSFRFNVQPMTEPPTIDFQEGKKLPDSR